MRVRFARSCLRERECLLRYSYLLTAQEILLFCSPRPRSLGLCPGRAVARVRVAQFLPGNRVRGFIVLLPSPRVGERGRG